MKIELKLADDFGPRLSDGGAALKYRITRIDPFVGGGAEFLLDFTGIRIANSSFINALLSELEPSHGGAALNRFTFQGCNQVLTVLIDSALALGQEKALKGSPAAGVPS